MGAYMPLYKLYIYTVSCTQEKLMVSLHIWPYTQIKEKMMMSSAIEDHYASSQIRGWKALVVIIKKIDGILFSVFRFHLMVHCLMVVVIFDFFQH